MDNTIYVRNRSTLVTDADVQKMTAACGKQIAQHVAPAHFVSPAPVLYLDKKAPLPTTQARIIDVLDVCDDPQALGYHTEDGRDHIWGVVGTKAVLDQGAKPLTGDYAVSTILSHEVAEMFMDPFCSLWAQRDERTCIAFEVGDPVQSDWYLIDGVAVSNFVTGAYFNPMAASTDRFDYLGKLRAPFTLSRGGYWVQMKAGAQSQKMGRGGMGVDLVWDEHAPAWLQMMKNGRYTRSARLHRGAFSAA